MSSSLDGMEAQDELSETKRNTRNKSEKKRRDAFNKLITELHSMVTSGERKLDKTNVLMQTIAYLKLHNQANTNGVADSMGPDKWKPSFLTNHEYTCLMMDGIGIIHKLRDTCSQDLKGTSVFDILDNKSGAALQKFLSAEVLRAASAHQQNSESEGKLLKSLNVRMRNSSDQLIPVRLVGKFKRVAFSAEDMYDLTERGLAISPTTETLCFVCVGRGTSSLISSRNYSVYRPMVDDKMEFTATFNMEWKFIGLDQRALSVIGYLPMEVMGTSGYDYYHPEDLDFLIKDHKQLIERGKTTSPPYRFLTKGEQWIWLQTRTYITYHQWNSKPEFVVATSWVLPDRDRAVKSQSEEPAETAVSSTSSLSALPKVKSEVNVKVSCGGSEGKSKQVFRPQPGVSIEHSPIPSSLSPRCGPGRRAASSPSGMSGTGQLESEDSRTSEHRLCEHLQRRHSNLQQQIMQHEQELRMLKEQLSRSHPVDLMAPPPSIGVQQQHLLAPLGIIPPETADNPNFRVEAPAYSSCAVVVPTTAGTSSLIGQNQNLANHGAAPQSWVQLGGSQMQMQLGGSHQ